VANQIGAHRFNNPDNVVTDQATANATTIAMIAPVRTVRKLALTTAHARFQIAVRR
jgi:hypothetical protein